MIEIVQRFEKNAKPIAALCHGAQILAAARVIEGKRVSAYPACAPEVEGAGGTFAHLQMHEAITDRNIVSGPAWPAHPAFLAQYVAMLERYLDREKSAETAAA